MVAVKKFIFIVKKGPIVLSLNIVLAIIELSYKVGSLNALPICHNIFNNVQNIYLQRII